MINGNNATPKLRLENLDPRESREPRVSKRVTLKYKQLRAVSVRSLPPVFRADTPTIEDPAGDV
ncbi:hypothetical protein N7476_004813 [Penicillium atrosanguineum]|uniref:Uncharacterized protein n=1 Tax=Penicillium atrosanguineum TaxID=1132637 RepID=A0A9W9PY58_9EURO|nr:hypothetical protein N7526_001892 [Penicillium atrosanguineum]KAJ5318393.1 hypothetical protein N7476_004813 [Penicillium atrosanguineum]